MVALGAQEHWPIVGRAAQLEAFKQALGSPRRAGLVVRGRAGVGKTRLADECLRWAATERHPTERVVGSRTTAMLPLGAVVALLADGWGRAGPDGQVDAVGLFENARLALQKRHAGRRVVTVADDVSLLDAASIALLDYLAGRGAIFLVATLRAGEAMPDRLTDLWLDGRLEQLNLEDLDRAQLDSLLNLALGGPIEARTARQLWEVSGGNPLYARELVLGALQSGALVERSGVWHLQDRLSSTGRLQDLVKQRIGGLPADAQWVIDRLALCQPLELGYFQAAVPAGVIEALEAAGLVTISLTEGEVRLAHPVHAEVVRAAIPRVRARAILLAEADRLEGSEPTGGTAALRITVWRLDAGGSPDPVILVRGATLARHTHDFGLVRRLMEALPDQQRDAVAALLLGEALYELGDFDAAERVLASGQALPASEAVALRLAVVRARNAHWGLCQPETALAINTQARRDITSPPLVEELVADEAAVWMFSGHPDRALAVLDRISGDDRRTRVVRAIVAAVALATTGRTAEALRVAEIGFTEHTALGDELAIAHPATHLVNQVFALTEAGRLSEGERVARAGIELVASHRLPTTQLWFAINLGRVATLQGRMLTARRYYAEAEGLAAVNGFAGTRRLALSGVALTRAMCAERDAAASAMKERDALPAFGFLDPVQQLADAWTAVAWRRSEEAIDRFRRAASQAAATGHRTAEAWLLHDLLRACGVDTSARLVELAGQCDSALISARARHAMAAARRDGGELLAAADDFEVLGAHLLAAEAASGAALAFSRAGDQRAAAAALRRSTALGAACEGANTPGLLHALPAIPLSGREREIAMLAAKGMTSKDIADRLSLSVRTVNNHLQSAYTKVGVNTRAELAHALGEST
jgi:DNA-binding CsgD family transcriptional regulator/tetratricopeptide (TPR) repeat protein